MKKLLLALGIIVIIFIVFVFLLVSFGVFWYVTSSATGGVNCKSESRGFAVRAFAVLAGSRGVMITLQNGTGSDVIVNSVIGSGDFRGVGEVSVSPVAANQTFKIMGIDAPERGTKFGNGRVTVNVTSKDLTYDFDVVCSGQV
ncbi:MAG: hypothetical protein QXK06_00810 [Candidatus Diapherotrites archaeon]